MAALTIREMTSSDVDLWLAMYRALFPEEARDGLRQEIYRILAAPHRHGFLAEQAGKAAGFAEYALRDYANGCYSQPVPFLEGIWVDPAYRRSGVARALIAHLEALARAGGYSEMGSDVLWDNHLSLEVHEHLGFVETERVVYFRKDL